MRRYISSVLILCSFLGLAACGQAVESGPAATGPAATGRYIVAFHPAVTKNPPARPAERLRFLQEQTARRIAAIATRASLRKVEPLWVAEAAVVSATPAQARELAAHPQVRGVFPVRPRSLGAPFVAADPVRAGTVQWGVKKIGVPDVWEQYKLDGSGVLVGEIDSGIDGTHPQLAGRIMAFRDFTPLARPEAYDDHGHGTHVAGTICGLDGVGVAPGAMLVVAKSYTKDGGSNDEILLKSMQWMLDPDGNPETNDAPRLVNNSWGNDPDPSDVVYFEAVKNWVAAGILPVFAAGNSGFGHNNTVNSPARFPISWAVGATKTNDSITYFSCQGPSTWEGETLVKPDICAPGEGIISCKSGGGLTDKSGTSMATPHVCGVVALMLQANPGLTIPEIRQIAESTALDKGDPGKDNVYGFGRIDALACVARILPQTPAANLVLGYRAALEAEQAWRGTSPASLLAAPAATSLIGRLRTLEDGEFATLVDRFRHEGGVSSLLSQAAAARRFDRLHARTE